MKKKLLALLLAMTMVMALAACGSQGGNAGGNTGGDAQNNTGDTGGSDAPSGDKIDISVIASQYGQNTTKWWADFADAFNAEHDNINLTVEVVSWNDIYTVVNTRLSNNSAPDILNIDVFADYQADGLLLLWGWLRPIRRRPP